MLFGTYNIDKSSFEHYIYEWNHKRRVTGFLTAETIINDIYIKFYYHILGIKILLFAFVIVHVISLFVYGYGAACFKQMACTSVFLSQ
jgi:hypothetical protein